MRILSRLAILLKEVFYLILPQRLLAFCLLLLIHMNTRAQSTADIIALATIVNPITIATTEDIYFGNIAVQEAFGCSVVLNTAGELTIDGGVTMPLINGAPTAAEFDVTGMPDLVFNITLPSSVYLSGPGTELLLANEFTSSISTSAAKLNDVGFCRFSVGAKLSVPASLQAGRYTSLNPFTITVNYN